MNTLMPIDILVIENNPTEAQLIVEIFKEDNGRVNIYRVKDGMEAIDYLHKKGKYKDSKTPSLITLALNLPVKNGVEVLEEIKNDDELKCIPVIILTNSNNESDIIKAYKNHANAYIIKPGDEDKLRAYITNLKHYWFNFVVLPKRT